MKMRNIKPEDFFGEDLKPKERLRFHQGRQVIVEMGAEHEDRLRELKELSKTTNKLLQEKFDAKNLPFSTKKDHSKALRYYIMFRPPFVSSMEDKTKNRLNTREDEIASCFHIDDENNLTGLRSVTGCQFIAEILVCSYAPNFNPMSAKEEFVKKIKAMDLAGITDFVADSLANNYGTEWLIKAGECRDLADFEQYFNMNESNFFIYVNDSIRKNLISMAMNSVIGNEIKSFDKKTSMDEFETKIKEKILELLNAEIRIEHCRPQPTTAKKYLLSEKRTEAELVGDLLKKAKEKFKKRIYS